MSDMERPVDIRVYADRPVGEMRPIWNYFGYDEANFTFTNEGKSLLSKLSSQGGGPTFIRTHHLLTSGNGDAWLKWSSSGVYDEDSDGNPIYEWSILDRIFDVLIEFGLKPLVEKLFLLLVSVVVYLLLTLIQIL